MYNGKFSFDVVDTDDSIDYDGQTYPESIFTSGDYANELTADRNADKWIKSFNSATKSEKSRMLGYTWNPDCEAVPQPVPPVRRARP
jgi:hypothetical protein